MRWIIISRQKTRQALIWWYGRQHIRMCQEAELIRNKTLQELFIIRRNLELSQLNNDENLFDNKCLDNIQTIHHSLKKLSEYLYPAHIDDSLPLAIRSLLESCKFRFSLSNLNLELPETWENGSEENSRIILAVIEELLRITLSKTSIISIFLKLEQQIDSCQLKMQIRNIANLSHDSYQLEFDFLSSIFQIFTGGKCDYYQSFCTHTWYFCWRSKIINDREKLKQYN
ncbi:MAG: hypothetical protein QNJ63_08495 [Calothrix sp. MO_192.B10]|nr:hypothetical protein [Calothrix sp. MO_192.B10]